MPNLDASPIPLFTFDRRIGRYRYQDSGRLLSAKAVEAITQRRVSAIAADMRTLGELLIDRKISLSAWQEATAKSIRESTVWSYTLSRGGLKNLSDKDYALMRSQVSQQLQFLSGFATDLQRGYSIAPNGSQTPMTIARFRSRLELYCNSSNAAKAIAVNQGAVVDRGAVAMKRLLGGIDRHCGDCVGYAGQGIRPIGFLPLPCQNCACGNRCRCTVIYFDAKGLANAIG